MHLTVIKIEIKKYNKSTQKQKLWDSENDPKIVSLSHTTCAK